MKKLWITILLLFSMSAFAQVDDESSYKNYTTKDGLAGNRVYAATQDKDGFMWFATETGVSRFDGTNFKNFTVAQGLPDNDIINLFADSKGRVWMCPFKNEICYYYKGKIYNKANDSLLSKLKLDSYSSSIAEDEVGNIVVHNSKYLAIIDYTNKIIERVQSVNDKKEFYQVIDDNKKVYVFNEKEIYNVSDGKLNSIYKIPNNSLRYFGKNKVIIKDSLLIFPSNYFNYSNNNQYYSIYQINLRNLNFNEIKVTEKSTDNSFKFNSNVLYLAGLNGVKIRSFEKNEVTKKPILFDTNINKIFIDGKDNFWYLSNFLGVILQRKTTIKLLSKQVIKYTNTISNDGNQIYLGGNKNNILFLKKKTFETGELVKSNEDNTLINSIIIDNRAIVVGSTSGIFIISKSINLSSTTIDKFIIDNNYNFLPLVNTKNIVQYNNFSLASTASNLLKLISTNKKVDTIFNKRTLCALYQNGYYYAGTINGLYKISEDKKAINLGEQFPVLNRRIVDIKENVDGAIWISTADEGVVGYRDGKIIAQIKEEHGLPSNICKTSYIDNNYLWVGTVNGMSKINIDQYPYKVITNYSTSDGLASNIINAILVEGDMVYVGTTDGFNYFNQQEISKSSSCLMRITDINISGNSIPSDTTNFTLKNKDNNIRIDFVGISYISNGEIKYSYKLEGLDTGWHTTTENYLSYPSLPSGAYKFLVQATDKFGNKSELVKIEFEIEKKLIEKWWFWVCLLSLLGLLTYFLIQRRFRIVKTRQSKEFTLQQKVHELEQMALKAQMNPHFTFNCLNSIQQYVIDANVEGANRFISSFSKLIRKTLDNSSKDFISLAEEESYLRIYLELESKRFEFPFEYEISIDSNIDKNEAMIAPMLLQPFVENAIRHGIKNKTDGNGKILIRFKGITNVYTCQIVDNGVGREKAAALKGSIAIEYQSKGMTLTARRIEVINMQGKQHIDLKIIDLYDANQNANGTEIKLMVTQK